MTKILDTSIQDGSINVAVKAGQIQVTATKGFRTLRTYSQADLSEVSTINEETFRNGGKAVAWAVAGGLLTGGIGFLAGAAFGGRRRKEGMYFLGLSDGNHVVIETTDKKLIAILQTIIIRKNMNAEPLAASQPTPTEEPVLVHQIPPPSQHPPPGSLQPGDNLKIYKGYVILKVENGVTVGREHFPGLLAAERYIDGLPSEGG